LLSIYVKGSSSNPVVSTRNLGTHKGGHTFDVCYNNEVLGFRNTKVAAITSFWRLETTFPKYVKVGSFSPDGKSYPQVCFIHSKNLWKSPWLVTT